jgi:hypothetical protein
VLLWPRGNIVPMAVRTNVKIFVVFRVTSWAVYELAANEYIY